jgi:hypothetical protein
MSGSLSFSLVKLSCAALLLIACGGDARGLVETPRPPREWYEFDNAGLFHARSNSDDGAIALQYRRTISHRFHTGATLTVSGRTWDETVLDEIGPHSYLQRRETRYLAWLGLDKIAHLARGFGVYAGAGGGYTFADFKGTEAAPEEGWTGVLTAGLMWKFSPTTQGFMYRIGYQYSDLQHDSKHWFTGGFGICW